jgi:hypothetical protein
MPSSLKGLNLNNRECNSRLSAQTRSTRKGLNVKHHGNQYTFDAALMTWTDYRLLATGHTPATGNWPPVTGNWQWRPSPPEAVSEAGLFRAPLRFGPARRVAKPFPSLARVFIPCRVCRSSHSYIQPFQGC